MSNYYITIEAEQSQNAGANTSAVRASLRFHWAAGWNWSYSSSNTWGSVTVGGETFNFTGPKSGGGSTAGSAIFYTSPWKTFTHDANGYRGAVGTSGYFTGDYLGSYSPYNLSATGPTFGAIDYDRRPSTPSFASISRSGTSYNVSVNAVSSPAGTATYYVQRSVNGGGYGDLKSSTGTSFTFTGFSPGQNVTFQTYAANSDGTSGTSTSGTYTLPNVPSAPASLNLSTSGTTIFITVGASNSNGGDSGTPTYRYRYSTNGGTTWSAYTTVTAGVQNTLSNMTPGLTYTFEADATNTVGTSTATTSSVLLVVGGKRWDGTEWKTNTTAKRWDGNAWRDLSVARRWDGTEWKVLT